MNNTDKLKTIYFAEDRESVDTDLFDLHLDHMTTENLRSKASIALELAYRDQKIAELKAENKKLRAFPDFKLPSECVARFAGHNGPIEALNKAALVACGFNDCRDWFKARRGEES